MRKPTLLTVLALAVWLGGCSFLPPPEDACDAASEVVRQAQQISPEFGAAVEAAAADGPCKGGGS